MRYKSVKNESCPIFTKFGTQVSKYKKTWFQEKKLLNWLMCANCGRSKVPKCGAEEPKNENCPIFTKFGIQLLKYKTNWLLEESFKISSLVPTVANQKCHNVVQKCQKMKIVRSCEIWYKTTQVQAELVSKRKLIELVHYCQLWLIQKCQNEVQKCQKMNVVRSSHDFTTTQVQEKLATRRKFYKMAHLCQLWPIKSTKIWCRGTKK